MSRDRSVVGVLFLLALTATVGCDPEIGRPVPGESEESTLFVVPERGAGSLISRNGATYRFRGGGQAIQRGTTIVGIAEGGYLRRVESVSVQSDGSVTTTTTQATLADAVEDGTFSFTSGPPTGKTPPNTKQFEVFQIRQNLTRQIYNQGGIVLRTSGDFELDVNIDLDITIRDHKLTYFGAAIFGTIFLDLTAEFEASGQRQFGTTGDGIPILSSPLRKYLYGLIGPVPVVIEVSANLYVGLTGNADATADFVAGFTAASDVRFGAEYNNGTWARIQQQGFSFDSAKPQWCLGGDVDSRVFVKPVIEIQLYTVLGPKFDIEPYLEFNASGDTCDRPDTVPSGSFEWDLVAGLVGHAKVKADILDRFVIESPSLTLFDLSWPLASGSGNADPLFVDAGTSRTILLDSCTTLSADVAGGDSPYSFAWSASGWTGSDRQTVSVCPARSTTYTVRVTDSTGQTEIDAVTISVEGNDDLVAAASADNTTITASESTTLRGSASGGTPPFTFAWSSPGWIGSNQQDVMVSPSATATYTLTVTDSSSPANTDSDVVTVNVDSSGGDMFFALWTTCGATPVRTSE